jgi:hypothetical protein
MGKCREHRSSPKAATCKHFPKRQIIAIYTTWFLVRQHKFFLLFSLLLAICCPPCFAAAQFDIPDTLTHKHKLQLQSKPGSNPQLSATG